MKSVLVFLLFFLLSYNLNSKEVDFTCECRNQKDIHILSSDNIEMDDSACAGIWEFSIDINKGKVNGKKIDLTITDDKIVWGDNPKPLGEGSSLKSTFDRYQGSLESMSAMDTKDLGFSHNHKWLRVKKYTCKKGKTGKLL
jgi:hypothetical protein